MKYLILTNHSHMLWQFRRDLLAALLTRGEVAVCTPFCGREEELVRLGCRLIRTEVDRRGLNPLTDLRLFFRYRRLIRAEKPDAVITYSVKPNIYGGLACRLSGVPCYVNVQGLGSAFRKKPLAALVTRMYRTALRRAERVFFENNANLTRFTENGIIRKEQAVLLPGAGVDTSLYAFSPYPSEEKGIVFLFAGRIMKEKGVEELFHAAERLKAEYRDRVRFVLAGFSEDHFSERLGALTEAEILEYCGFQTDLLPLYQSCHCVVLPSYHEGMSNVLLEGASVGRALITSDIPGCREAVLPEESGYLCPPADSEGLYRCLKRFLALTPEERAAMGRRGREHMAAFEKKTVVALTLSHLPAEENNA